MKSKQRAETVAEAIELVYDSLVSHLEWTHKATSEGVKFHKKCVKEYAALIKLLSDLY